MDTKILTDLAGDVKAVAQEVEELKSGYADFKEARAELSDLAAKAGATSEQLDNLTRDVMEYRKLAERQFGKSGGLDFREEFSKWIKAVYHIQKNKKMPAYLEKAAADYVGDTDAQGGYFVPELLKPGIIPLTEVHGTLFPYLDKIIIPPGQDVVVPHDSTLPTMTWRCGSTAQGTAGTEEAGPIAFGADTLNSKWLHDYVKFANELLQTAAIRVADAFAVRMISKGTRAMEYGVLQGDDSGDAYPHDGVFVASGVNDQTDLATPTFANVCTFLSEAIDPSTGNEGAADQGGNQLVTTPGAALKLATEAVGSSELTGMLVWGDPRKGIPSKLLGYDFIPHPGAYETNHRIAIGPFQKVVLGWTGNFKVDFNAVSGWTSNETWMMVSTHADYVLGNTDMYSKADITALS